MQDVAAHVLAAFPAPLGGRLEFLGNRGGFSGARLWRLHSPAGLLCLRAGAPGESRDNLVSRHRMMRMAAEAGLDFVPLVMSTSGGETVIEAVGRCWELMQWLPGRADYRGCPSPTRLRAAAGALARLHRAWEPLGGAIARPCPAVVRRLEAVAAWPGHPHLSSIRTIPLLHRLEQTVARWLPHVPVLLDEVQQACRMQPCLRDVWHDHLLFEGERLTGLVDYASVAEDSVTTDLARMLGSLVEDEETGWQVGLEAYREVRGLSANEERLARVLDRTGVIVGLSNWLRWLTDARRTFDDRHGVEQRTETLLTRVERWEIR
jgi:Ser/Thr protein kinase RdoA (MazF antagonist)